MTGPPRPRAAVIAVGSELLDLGRSDTNSPFIAGLLGRYGIGVAFTAVVSDEWDDLVAALRHALNTVDLVVCTGGLGPTDDDRTRDAAAAVLGLTMREDAAVVAQIEQRFRARQLEMPPSNRRQAQVPEGATVVPNPRGTAPGLWIPVAGTGRGFVARSAAGDAAHGRTRDRAARVGGVARVAQRPPLPARGGPQRVVGR